jgi:hypothetical protein
MIVLDENFPDSQRRLLRSWRIPVRQIGVEVGDKGMSDEAIIPLLMKLRGATFVTLDFDFYRRKLAHPALSLIVIDTGQYEAASFTRRALRHPRLSTAAKRRGAVIRVQHTSLTIWTVRGEAEERYDW